MRSKLGAGTLAGILAALPYGIVMWVATAPMMTGGPEALMPAGGPGLGGAMGADGREPMILMVSRLARSESLSLAWILLLIAGAVMGALFAALLGDRARVVRPALLWGALYGACWWIAASLVFMPVVLGMGAFSPLTTAPMRGGALIMLAAYLASGMILGALFAALHERRHASDTMLA